MGSVDEALLSGQVRLKEEFLFISISGINLKEIFCVKVELKSLFSSKEERWKKTYISLDIFKMLFIFMGC